MTLIPVIAVRLGEKIKNYFTLMNLMTKTKNYYNYNYFPYTYATMQLNLADAPDVSPDWFLSSLITLSAILNRSLVKCCPTLAVTISSILSRKCLTCSLLLLACCLTHSIYLHTWRPVLTHVCWTGSNHQWTCPLDHLHE